MIETVVLGIEEDEWKYLVSTNPDENLRVFIAFKGEAVGDIKI